LQEIALAREIVVLYGSVALPWDFFKRLDVMSVLILWNTVVGMKPRQDFKIAAMEKFKTITLFIQAREKQQVWTDGRKDILTLLHEYSYLDATDMRDKIYGFYGLATDSARFITVDYSKPAADVYESFARRHIPELQPCWPLLTAQLKPVANQTLNGQF
jgi:hypothetical protein